MTATISKVIVLVVITCALQFGVIAAQQELIGKLRTRDNKPISVNDKKVRSGAPVPTGADLRCPDKIGATIELGQLGHIEMAPKTDLRLGFNAYGVTIHLRSGYVVLTTNKGIPGTITTSEGKLVRTDLSKVSSVVARTKEAIDPQTIGAGGETVSN